MRLSTRSTFYFALQYVTSKLSSHREEKEIITVKYHTYVDEEKTVPFRCFDLHLQTWPVVFTYLI